MLRWSLGRERVASVFQGGEEVANILLQVLHTENGLVPFKLQELM